MKLTPPNITPGPWSFTKAMEKQDCGLRILTPKSAPYGMAHIYSPGANAEANARAISATPDALAALAELLRAYENKHGVTISGDTGLALAVFAARAALIKAGYTIEE